jgi:hypothetical protein
VYALVGVFFLVLSFFTAVQTWRFLHEPQVLGSQTLAQAVGGSGQEGQEGQDGRGGQILQPTKGIETGPTIVSQPTDTIIREPTSVPPPIEIIPEPTTVISEPTPTPVQEEVTITDPETEIIIRNDDNTLVIIDTSTGNPIAEVPSVPTDSEDNTRPADTVPHIDSQTSAPIAMIPTPDSSNSLAVLPTTSPLVAAQEPTIIPSPGPNPGTFFTDVINTVGSPFGIRYSSPRARNPSDVNIEEAPSFFGFTINLFGDSNKTVARSRSIPASSIKITYAAGGPQSNLDEWLKKYQFQVWALGEDYIAIYRNGVTTITPYAIKLGLSKLSFKVDTERGEMQVLYYPDAIWSYLSDVHLISENTHDEPLVLISENDELMYHVTGHSNQFFFALIPTSVCREISISARTREIQESSSCSAWDSIMDLLSLTI